MSVCQIQARLTVYKNKKYEPLLVIRGYCPWHDNKNLMTTTFDQGAWCSCVSVVHFPVIELPTHNLCSLASHSLQQHKHYVKILSWNLGHFTTEALSTTRFTFTIIYAHIVFLFISWILCLRSAYVYWMPVCNSLTLWIANRQPCARSAYLSIICFSLQAGLIAVWCLCK